MLSSDSFTEIKIEESKNADDLQLSRTYAIFGDNAEWQQQM